MLDLCTVTITSCYPKISATQNYGILNILTNIMITKPNRLLQTIFIWNELKLKMGNYLAHTSDIEAEVGLWNKISPTFKQLPYQNTHLPNK